MLFCGNRIYLTMNRIGFVEWKSRRRRCCRRCRHRLDSTHRPLVKTKLRLLFCSVVVLLLLLSKTNILIDTRKLNYYVMLLLIYSISIDLKFFVPLFFFFFLLNYRSSWELYSSRHFKFRRRRTYFSTRREQMWVSKKFHEKLQLIFSCSFKYMFVILLKRVKTLK